MPEMEAAPFFTVKVPELIVKGSIGSLKVAEIWMPVETPTARFAGTVDITLGATGIGMPPASGPGVDTVVDCNVA